MHLDEDIKIAGDKPSYTVKLNRLKEEEKVNLKDSEAQKAKKLGVLIAERYINEVKSTNEEPSSDLSLQIRLLLSFTATVGFEHFCKDDTVSGIAQKSFIDRLRAEGDEFYKTSSDMGAFSFYYLAYRRGGDIERRMGQTFAMLCSSDGDPIYQERGEALYCWLSAEIRKAISDLGLKN